MSSEALAVLLFKEIEKIARNQELDTAGKTDALYRLLSLIFVEASKKEQLLFSTLFARMAYVCHQQQIERRLQYYLHAFRRMATDRRQGQEAAGVALGLKVNAAIIEALWQTPAPESLTLLLPTDWPIPFATSKAQSFRAKARVLALSDEPDSNTLVARDEARPEDPIRISYNITGHNDNFELTIKTLRSVFGFPTALNLLDVEIDQEGVYRPKAIVIAPDYLLDVSAVAEAFRDGQVDPWGFLLKRFLPFAPSAALVVGNIANYFLDQLMTFPGITFQDLRQKLFHTNPLAFCLFSDGEIKAILQDIQKHYVTLNQMTKGGFQAENISPEDCTLEPTFFSETYGLQGRLDVFYRDPTGSSRSAIVELKSGKPFMPNAYGIGASHYIQTLLYDLLIRSAYGKQLNPICYILYSGQEEKPLRYAPAVKSLQYEALQARNQLVAIEWLLSGLSAQGDDLLDAGRKLFGKLNPQNFKGFVQRDMALFYQAYQALNNLERKYFVAFSGFIAREQQLAKTGQQGIDAPNGMAALWLNKLEEKQENFEVLSHLQVINNRAREEDPLIIFSRTTKTNALANFRKGDIAVLYPLADDVLSGQIFKCTIVEMVNNEVITRLRSPQFNDRIFNEIDYWNLEHDLLDSSFNSLYRSLFEWTLTTPGKRRLLLTQEAPREGTPIELAPIEELTEEQFAILKAALGAPDYFLLWGPPGTGKTSLMLKHMVGWLLAHTRENVLLLAYTNRAVDEICASIEELGGDISRHYLRIGSRYSTEQRFLPQLLDAKTSKARTRQELLAVIEGHRIIVATVAGIMAKPELLQLKKFQRVIIDEASQVLEPALAGLLPRFERFILIGDHQQLPAVVAQSPQASAVDDPDLQALGMLNLRNSFFERLYKRCQSEGWNWAYAQLSHQGRMHQDIMTFPNQYFYNKTLKILPPGTRTHERQKSPLPHPDLGGLDKLEDLLCRERNIFLSTPVDESSANQKTNVHEATLVADLVARIQKLYAASGRDFNAGSLGIITPYRAQIAQIRSVLEKQGINPAMLTIDTVERYQGGARDIILLSLCTNSLSQLSALISLSDEGTDRRLNVALTRAREQVIVLGNREILGNSPLYEALMADCRGW
ncbi:MAG: AAA family ATPase [Saprospiraceae bacterium]|nr:AAA family ATPase [Saprospiraceae bacterium]